MKTQIPENISDYAATRLRDAVAHRAIYLNSLYVYHVVEMCTQMTVKTILENGYNSTLLLQHPSMIQNRSIHSFYTSIVRDLLLNGNWYGIYNPPMHEEGSDCDYVVYGSIHRQDFQTIVPDVTSEAYRGYPDFALTVCSGRIPASEVLHLTLNDVQQSPLEHLDHLFEDIDKPADVERILTPEVVALAYSVPLSLVQGKTIPEDIHLYQELFVSPLAKQIRHDFNFELDRVLAHHHGKQKRVA